MSDFKTKMHQIWCPGGGAYIAPRTPYLYLRRLFLRGGRGEGKERKGERKGREGGNKGNNGDGEEGKGREWKKE